MGASVWVFALSVWHHWEPLVLSGAVGVLIFVYEHRKKEPVSWRLIGYIMAAALLVSCFSAWRDQYTSAEWRGGEVQRLNGVTQAQQSRIQGLQTIAENKDRPIIVRSDPALDALVKEQNVELAVLKQRMPSPRKQALQLSHDILLFYAQQEKEEPEVVPPMGLTESQWVAVVNSQNQNEITYIKQMFARFTERFAVRIQQLEDDVQSDKISSEGFYRCHSGMEGVGATFEIEECGTYLGVLANKLPNK